MFDKDPSTKKTNPGRAKLALGAMSLFMVLGGCAKSNVSDASLSKPMLERVIEYEGADWSIECNGPPAYIKARHFDTLLILAGRAGTMLTEPAQFILPSVPAVVWGEALSDINHLSDANLIYTGYTYTLPAVCYEQ